MSLKCTKLHRFAPIFSKKNSGVTSQIYRTGEGFSPLPRLLPFDERPPSHCFRASAAADCILPMRVCSLKSLQLVLQQQSMVLNQIAEKLDVNVQHPALGFTSSQQHRMSVVPPDGGLHAAGPESLQVGRHGSSMGTERPYRRSIRITIDRDERPPSTVL